MSSRSRRPGPLQELPLELFVPAESLVVPSSPCKLASKRPRSPSVLPSPMSPAKRRLLNDEGVLFSPLSPKSPDKSRRSEYLSLGLLSPRRLDFERVEMEMKTPSESEVHKVQTPSTPRAQRIAGHPRKLAPSPELVSSPPSAKRLDKANISSDLPRGRSTSPSLPSPLRVPRDLPACSDRQSTHYPGFDVHRDAFIELTSTRSQSSDEDADAEEDDMKENVAPKRRPRNMILGAPAFMKLEGVSATPRRSEQLKASFTPRSATPKLSRSAATPKVNLMPPPSFTPNRSPDKSEIIDRKRAMEQEVDEAAASDDEGV